MSRSAGRAWTVEPGLSHARHASDRPDPRIVQCTVGRRDSSIAMIRIAGLLLLLAGLCAPSPARRSRSSSPGSRRPPAIDGRLDEPLWDSLAPLPMVGYKPTFGIAPSESTDVRVAHDGRAFYVGAALYHRDPAGVQAWSRGRDEDNGGDFLNVLLDTFNDGENAVTFSTTPPGPRLDFSVATDAEGDNSITGAWNGVWDVRTRRDERGWYAEFRIPFSTLRYQATGGVVRMRLIVNRLIGGKNERVIFPAIPPRWAFGMFKPSQAHEVEFRGVEAGRQLLITPYGLGGHQPAGPARSRAGRWVAGSDLRHELGADIKLAVSNDINLDLTANTDFAETEVDDQRLNLTRFPLFFPERRQFFIERAGRVLVRLRPRQPAVSQPADRAGRRRHTGPPLRWRASGGPARRLRSWPPRHAGGTIRNVGRRELRRGAGSPPGLQPGIVRGCHAHHTARRRRCCRRGLRRLAPAGRPALRPAHRGGLVRAGRRHACRRARSSAPHWASGWSGARRRDWASSRACSAWARGSTRRSGFSRPTGS